MITIKGESYRLRDKKKAGLIEVKRVETKTGVGQDQIGKPGDIRVTLGSALTAGHQGRDALAPGRHAVEFRSCYVIGTDLF